MKNPQHEMHINASCTRASAPHRMPCSCRVAPTNLGFLAMIASWRARASTGVLEDTRPLRRPSSTSPNSMESTQCNWRIGRQRATAKTSALITHSVEHCIPTVTQLARRSGPSPATLSESLELHGRDHSLWFNGVAAVEPPVFDPDIADPGAGR